MRSENQEGCCDDCGYEFQPNSQDGRDFPILVGLARYKCELCVSHFNNLTCATPTKENKHD